MAAPTTTIDGVAYVLYTGTSDPATTTIGGGTNGTLSFTKNMTPVVSTTTPDGFARYCPGLKLGSLSGDLEFLESGSQLCIEANRTLKVGGSLGTELKGVQSVTLNLSADMLPLTSYDSADTTYQNLVPGLRTFSFDISGLWYDPNYDTARETLIANWESGTTFVSDIYLTFGSTIIFEFDAWVSNFNINRSVVDASPMDWSCSMMVEGPLTSNTAYGNADAGHEILIDAITATSGVTKLYYLFQYQTDAEEWSGAGYPSNISITVPVDGLVTSSFVLETDGAITRAATT